MAAAARAAGLSAVHAEERPSTSASPTPAQLIRYRLGQPPFASWLDAIGAAAAEELAAAAAEAIGADMQPYQPTVVFLSPPPRWAAPRVSVPATEPRRPGSAVTALRKGQAAGGRAPD
jgi:hypothetical protein